MLLANTTYFVLAVFSSHSYRFPALLNWDTNRFLQFPSSACFASMLSTHFTLKISLVEMSCLVRFG